MSDAIPSYEQLLADKRQEKLDTEIAEAKRAFTSKILIAAFLAGVAAICMCMSIIMFTHSDMEGGDGFKFFILFTGLDFAAVVNAVTAIEPVWLTAMDIQALKNVRAQQRFNAEATSTTL